MIPKIDHYSFGTMTIDNKRHTSDLILYPDGRIRDNWFRRQGHHLAPDDINDLFDAAPEILVIGMGSSGLMQVSEMVLAICNKLGIKAEAHPTETAVIRYNQAVEAGLSVAACFHLTC